MNLRVKLIILFLAVSLSPFVVISAVSYKIIQRELTRATLAQLSTIASQQEQKINTILQQLTEFTTTLAGSLAFRLALNQYRKDSNAINNIGLNAILTEYYNQASNITGISFLDQNGVVVASSDEKKIGVNPIPLKHIAHIKAREITAHILTNPTPTIFVTVKIQDNGSNVGFLLVESDIGTILAVVRNLSGLGETGETILGQRDEEDTIEYITPVRFDQTATLTRKISTADMKAPMSHAIARRETILDNAVDYRNTSILAVTRYIESADWGLVVKIDRAEAYAPIWRLSIIFSGIIGMSVVVIIISAFLVAAHVTTPIEQLTELASDMSSGNLSNRSDIRSGDEIGQLSQAFNQMSDKLSQSYEALEERIKIRTNELEDAKRKLELANVGLEEQVLKRTQELEKAKMTLEAEVEKRTRELNNKIKELASVNQFMINREVRMGELKEEIERLKGKNDKPS